MPDPTRPAVRHLVAALDRLTEQARRIADQGAPHGYRPTGTIPELTVAPATPPPIAEQPTPDVLRVLLDRVQHGIALTPDEGRLLREHVNQLRADLESAHAQIEVYEAHRDRCGRTTHTATREQPGRA